MSRNLYDFLTQSFLFHDAQIENTYRGGPLHEGGNPTRSGAPTLFRAVQGLAGEAQERAKMETWRAAFLQHLHEAVDAWAWANWPIADEAKLASVTSAITALVAHDALFDLPRALLSQSMSTLQFSFAHELLTMQPPRRESIDLRLKWKSWEGKIALEMRRRGRTVRQANRKSRNLVRLQAPPPF